MNGEAKHEMHPVLTSIIVTCTQKLTPGRVSMILTVHILFTPFRGFLVLSVFSSQTQSREQQIFLAEKDQNKAVLVLSIILRFEHSKG